MLMQVGHVGVRTLKLLHSERHSGRELSDLAASAGFCPAFLWRLLQRLLGLLGGLSAGRYLLTHAPGSTSVCVFAALPEEVAMEQVRFQYR
jgi:hypothetical protein